MTTTHPQLVLNADGELILQTPAGAKRVRAARSFPWTAPERFIVLRDATTDEAPEILTIEDLAELPGETRRIVEAWLERHTLIPRVRRVLEVKSGNTTLLFQLDTDRGDRRIKVGEREDLRPLADGRTLIRDVTGVVYELPPLESLDEESRQHLRMVL